MSEVAETTQDPAVLVAEVEALGTRLSRVREAIGRVIFGQDLVVERVLNRSQPIMHAVAAPSAACCSRKTARPGFARS